MKYLYSRMLTGEPEPAKAKKRAPKTPKPPKAVKPPKPRVDNKAPQTMATTPKAPNAMLATSSAISTTPKAMLAAPKAMPATSTAMPAASSAMPAIHNSMSTTLPAAAVGTNTQNWRSEPTGSNRSIVVPAPVRLFNSVPNIPAKKTSKETKEPKKTNVEPEKITHKAKSAKRAKLSSTTEDQPLPIIQNTTSANTKSKPAAKSTAKPASKPKTKAQATEARGRKRTIETDDEDEPTQRKVPKSQRKNQQLPILNGAYKLSTVFKGHIDINVPAKDRNDHEIEDAKDIWCCEFEPHRLGQEERTNTVAICGSYSVLLLDTQQGRYTKKYTHSEIQEIFYCMAWTTLSGAEMLNQNIMEGDQSCNILAIAGRLGSIKLLNPLQNECYRYLFGHDKAVLKLAFAKTEPRWLLSASADKTVRLWDIGSPTSKTDDSVCLAKFSLPTGSSVPSALSISYDLSTLVVGFDNGDMAIFHISSELLDSFREKSEQYRTKEAPHGDKWASFGAIATIQPQMVYPRGSEWHAGYVDDVYIFGQDGDKSSKLYNRIISRGADDMEFIVWNPEKSTPTDADIQLSLEWPDSADCSGVRYKVIEAEGQKVLLAGEYDGQLYIYDVGNSRKSKMLADKSVEKSEPTRILSHAMSSELIRDVCCSNDTRTIVAVDNNNTVFVWNCTDN